MNKGLQGRRENKDPQEVLVRQGLRVLKDHRERPEVLVLRVRPVHKALKEIRVQ